MSKIIIEEVVERKYRVGQCPAAATPQQAVEIALLQSLTLLELNTYATPLDAGAAMTKQLLVNAENYRDLLNAWLTC
jgi:hypothetical protein